jgi:Rieske Fe-S protein
MNPDDAKAPETRRSFLAWLSIGLGGIAVTLTAVPFIGYLLGPLLKKRQVEWQSLGEVNKFKPGETRAEVFTNPLRRPWDGMTAETLVYVRRLDSGTSEPSFQVFAANCAHLGCPVTWFAQSKLFMCPCHGGVYYEDGQRASGPPPRGLFECVRKIEDGQLWIQAPHLPTLQDTLEKPA